MPIEFFDEVLPELVRSCHEGDHRPVLPDGTRDDVVLVLENLVVVPLMLDLYIGTLSVIEPDVPGIDTTYSLEENELQAILDGCWELVTDSLLAMLMLRPRTIMEIGRRVVQEKPKYWVGVREREVRRLMGPD